jgi:hypothetical protein
LSTAITQATGPEITGPGTYYYCYVVTDAQPSSASSDWNAVTVDSALTAPTAPTPSAGSLDVNQALTVTGTIPSSGTPTYSWQWLVSLNGGAYTTVTHCAVTSGTGATGGTPETCAIAASTLIAGDNYAYELKVTDSATTPETLPSPASSTVAVSLTLGVVATPTVSATKLDYNQALTVSGTIPLTGTPTYSWQWLVQLNGAGSYVDTTQCAANSGSLASGGAPVTCLIAASTLTVTDTYKFELQVTDSATVTESATSAASAKVTVTSTLTTPATPIPSATSLPASQTLTVPGTIPATGASTYSWQWLVSVNSGVYASATQCAIPGGSGAVSGGETCTIPGGTLTANTNYNFELRVTDTATSPETTTSLPSATVATTGALTAGLPTPANPSIDNGQSLGLTANPSGGSGSYATFTWFSTTSAATAATACGSGGWGSSVQSSSSATYTTPSLTVTTYYCYEVTDTTPTTAPSPADQVTVFTALTTPVTPTVSATLIDLNQGLIVSGTIPSTGTPSYSWQWLVSVNGLPYVAATSCAINSGSGAAVGAAATCSIAANTLIAGDTYAFELKVTDSAFSPVTLTSSPSSTVAVSSTLGVVATPTVSATKLDYNQALTVSGTIPLTGTPTYSWQWLVLVNGAGGYNDATQCALNSGSGANGGAPVTCLIAASTLTVTDTYKFELQVTDGATATETATSIASATVTVDAVLVAPVISVAPVTIDNGQSSTLSTTTSFSGGWSTYTCQWLDEVPSGSFVNLGSSFVCTVGSMPTASTGALSTTGTWHFELQVKDSAGTPVTVTSNVVAVTADPALVAPTISVAPITLDSGQNATLSTVASFSGGTPTYTCQWLDEAPSGSFVDLGSSFACTVGSMPTVSTGILSTNGTWSFELQVTDSSGTPATATSNIVTVTVDVALVAPVISVAPTTIDNGQSSTLSTTTSFSGGTSTYTCQWLEEAPSGSFVNLGSSFACLLGSTPTVSTGVLSTTGTWHFELQVTDSSGTPVAVTSNVVAVTVDAALVAPVISVAPTTIDNGQSSTLSTTTSFSGGTSTYTCQWLEEAPSGSFVNLGSSFACLLGSTPTVSTGGLSTTGTWSFELQVTDSSGTPATSTSNIVTVTVSAALVAPVISVVPTTIDNGQSSTLSTTTSFSGGTSTYTCQWLEEAPSGSFVNLGSSFACLLGSTPTVSTGTLTTTGTWHFELQVTDSSGTPVAVTSNVVAVTVDAALVAPVISVAPTTIDNGQSSTLSTTTSFSGGTSTYTCQWLDEVPSGSFVNLGSSFACLLGSTPTVSTGVLSTTGTWHFELQVTDSSGTPVTVTSNVVVVTVDAALVAPVISVAPATIDNGQSSTLSTTTSFSGGTSTYTCQWLDEVPSGSFVNLGSSFACTVGSTPTVPTGTLSTTGTWHFELQVKDSSGTPVTVTSNVVAVTVDAALVAPVISVAPATIDNGQPSTLSTTTSFSGGTSTYTCQWLDEVPSGSFVNLGSSFACTVGSTPTVSTGVLSTTGTWHFELQVKDSSGTPVTVTSNVVVVTVDAALVAPVISVAPATIDNGQSSTLSTTTSFSGGTSTYTCQWLDEVPSGSFVNLGSSFACLLGSTPTVSTGVLSTTGTWHFELQVKDSSGTPVTVTSNVVAVTVDAALVAPVISVAPATIDNGQPSTLSTTTSFSGGTSTYTCQWLDEVPSGSFVNLGSSFACVLGSTPTVSTGVLSTTGTWSFELQVKDSSGTPVTVTSNVVAVTVDATLVAPVISVAPTTIDNGQSSTLSTTTSFSGGTSTYTCQWLDEVPSGSFVNLGSSFACTVGSTPTVPTGTLSTTGTWSFELQVKDSSGIPVTITSNVVAVTVDAALVAPVISVAPTTIDNGQSSTLSTTTSFSGGTSTYTCQWLDEVPSGSFVNLGSSFACLLGSTPTVSTGTLTTTGTWHFELQVTDSSGTPTTVTSNVVAVTVDAALVAAVISVSPVTIDNGQSATLSTTTSFSGGTSTYTCQWLDEVPSGSFVNLGSSFACTVGSTPTVSTGVLSTTGTWHFELQVTDSSGTPATSTSNIVTVTVSAALVAPVISVAPATIDNGQSSTLSTTTSFSGGTSTYTCQWLDEVPSGSFVNLGSSFACLLGSTPTVSTGVLSTTGTWHFELQVKDSSGTPVTVTSNVVVVTVDSDPTVSVTPLGPLAYDVGQTAGVLTAAITYSGPNTATVEWYSSSTPSCSASSTDTGTSGLTFTPSTGSAGTTYYCAVVSDSGVSGYTSPSNSVEVVVGSALTAGIPTPTNPMIDNGQSIPLAANPSGGATPYSYQWYSGTGTGACAGTSLGTSQTQSTGALVTGTYYYCYVVTDDDSNSAASGWDTVTVNAPLVAPVISVAPTTIDNGQSSTLSTTTSFSGGTSTYTCQWLDEAPSGSFVNLGSSFACVLGSKPTVSTGVLSTTGTWHFELQVKDSSGTPVTVTSNVVVVTVDAALVAPVISVAPATIDNGQSSTLSTTTSFSGGTSTYTCQWLDEVPSGSFVNLGSSFACTVGSTPTVSTGVLSTTGTWHFELQVKDSSGTPVTVTSNVVAVTVDAALVAPVISVAPATIDNGQSSTLSTTTSFSGGTSTYTCQWLDEVPSGSFVNLGSSFACLLGSTPTVSTGVLSTTGTWHFELQVKDSSGTPVTVTSNVVVVTVDSDPTVSVTPLGPLAYDVGQTAGVLTAAITYSGPNTATVEWYSSSTPSCSASSTDTGTSGLTFTPSTGSAGTTYYCAVVSDSGVSGYTSPSNSVEVMVGVTLTAGAPTPSNPIIDSGQSIALTANASGGSTPYTNYAWYNTSSSTTAATLCGLSGWEFIVQSSTLTTYVTGSLTGTAYYCYVVTDSTTPTPTNASSSVDQVTVNSAPSILVSPSSVTIDSGQTVTLSATVTGGTTTFSWQWYNGSGPISGQSGSGSTAVYTVSSADSGIYVIFTDTGVTSGATPPSDAQVASSPSVTVTVYPGPSISTQPMSVTIDSGQTVTLSVTVTGGTGIFSWQWYTGSGPISGATGSGPTAMYVATAAVSGIYVVFTDTGVTSGAIPTSAAQAPSSTASVTVDSAPSISVQPTSATIDSGQRVTLSATVAGGTGTFGWQWYDTEGPISGASGSGTTATYLALATEVGIYVVFTDTGAASGASPTATARSVAVSVTVNPALTPPFTPAASATKLDADQPLSVTAGIPTTGTSSYAWQWLVSVNGGAFAVSTQCAVNSGSGALGGSTETCNIGLSTLTAGDSYEFELMVTDSAAVPETVTSSASETVTVSSTLAAPAPPALSASALNVVQGLTVTGTLPLTGTPAYSWAWLVSVNGGAYAPATLCATISGSAASGGASETCSVAANTLTAGDTYTFEIQVTDNASAPETATSSASGQVVVTAPVISIGPTQGPTGATFTVTGSGFDWSSGATVTLNSVLVVPMKCTDGTLSGGTITTDDSGRFVCTFTVPSEAAGAYSLVAEDTATGARATAEVFTVTTPTITVNPPQAPVGATVTVSGTGFSVSTPLSSLVFDSEAISSCASGSLTTGSTGTFNCTFEVPSGASGTSVTATDVGGQAASVSFAVTGGGAAPSSIPWVWIIVAIVLVAAALAAVVVLRRRRATGRAAGSGGPARAEPSSSGATGPASTTPAYLEPTEDSAPSSSYAAPGVPVTRATEPVADSLAVALAAVPVTGAAVTPRPTLAPTPTTAPQPTTAPPPPTTPPTSTPAVPAEDAKVDIDSVLAELDAISGQILKPEPKKGTGNPPAEGTEGHTEGDGGR